MSTLIDRMKEIKNAAKNTIDLSFVEETPGGIGDPVVLPMLAEAYLETGILPWDRRLRYRFFRFFTKYDPFVARAIELHSELPLSKLRATKTVSVAEWQTAKADYFFTKQISQIGLFKKLIAASADYNTIGDVFILHLWNESETMLQDIIILPPERVEVELDGADRVYYLIEADNKTRTEMNQDPMKGSYIYQLSRQRSDYAPFGTSLLERNLKRLFYRERLYQLEARNISKALNAIDMISIDSDGNKEISDNLGDQIMAANMDPENKVITNYPVTWNRIGAMEGMADLDPKWDRTKSELITGLGVTEGLMNGETIYSAEKLALEAIARNYLLYREMVQDYVENYIFKPLAVKNGFYDWVDRETGKVITNINKYLIHKDFEVEDEENENPETKVHMPEEVEGVDLLPNEDEEPATSVLSHKRTHMETTIQFNGRNTNKISSKFGEILNKYLIHKKESAQHFNPMTDFQRIDEFMLDPELVDKQYVYPKLRFDRLPLKDDDNLFNALMNLYTKGSLPLAVILEMLDLDPSDVTEGIMKDLYTIRDPNTNAMLQQAYNSFGNVLAENQDLQNKLLANLGIKPQEKAAPEESPMGGMGTSPDETFGPSMETT